MRILPLLSALLLFFAGSVQAQRTCAAESVLAQQLLENPLFQQQLEQIEQHTHDYIHGGGVHDRIVVTIPVVFNVVWNTTAENISDTRLLEQLQVLNDDFRRLNADAVNTPSGFAGVAADCEVNFCLATQDPNGAATTGIRRQNTATTSFSTNDAVKYTAQGGLDAWSRDKYLNIWVCDLGGGLLGYAQFPGGPAATDGVVLDYAYTGVNGASAPFNKGRTGTHEVGHWLNLYHIWGDDGTSCSGTDNCADTPNQADENYGCPAFPTVSCTNGPNGDMFMNYMDYTDDACMNLFTAGQKARMQALFSTGGARFALLSSPGCQPPTGTTCNAPTGLNATNVTQTSATLNWGAVSGATSYTLQWKATSAASFTTVSNITGTSYNLSGLTAATGYTYQVRTNCASGSSAYSAAATFTTQSSGTTCNTPTGLSTTGITQTAATLSWGAVSGASSYTLQWKAASAASFTTVSNLTTTSYNLSGLTAGTAYTWQVSTNCASGSSAYSAAVNFTTQSSGGSCSNLYEPNETRQTAKTIPVNTDINSQIATATDKDWNKFANTSAQRRIKVELTNLPADYDLQLWRSASLLATSQNAGTANESIIYNTTTVSSSYYAYVYGYNSAYSNTACYKLRVSLSATNWREDGSTDGEVIEGEIPVAFVDLGFGMYPNPAANNLTLDVPMEADADVQVTIYDATGKSTIQTNRSLTKEDNQIQVDLSNLQNGLYMVQVRNGDKINTRKLVVQK